MSEYAVNPVIPSDNALLSATLNQQLTPAPHAYVVATETSQPQPVYGQPMANGQPQYGQSAHVQPDQSQYFQPVLVIGAGNGILDAQGVPNAQTVMTSAGMVTVGMSQPIGVKCTSGLEYMSALGKIWIKEMPQLIEQFTNFEANQKFQCLNSEGQQVYWSQENTGSCTRQCLGASRPFHIDIHTPSGQIAMQLDRPFRCNSVCILGCLPLNFCFLQDLAVTDSAGDVIGHVIQKASLRPFFDLIDDCGTVLCHIDGPWMMNCCSSFSDVVFNIYEPNTTENPVGTLTKKWGGFIRESLLSNADNFACAFPTKISVSGKALIFATTFLIDFMYFEDKKKKKRGAVEH